MPLVVNNFGQFDFSLPDSDWTQIGDMIIDTSDIDWLDIIAQYGPKIIDAFLNKDKGKDKESGGKQVITIPVPSPAPSPFYPPYPAPEPKLPEEKVIVVYPPQQSFTYPQYPQYPQYQPYPVIQQGINISTDTLILAFGALIFLIGLLKR